MTVTFAAFEAAAPELAAFTRGRIDDTGLSFVATTRSDGWPRNSGWELFVCDGRLYVGSMPDAVKVKDLRRDPRCCVITPLADRDDTTGEAKLFCIAREVDTAEEWAAARALFLEVRGFDMGEPGSNHLFELQVGGAAWTRVEGAELITTSWAEGQAVRVRKRDSSTGESLEST